MHRVRDAGQFDNLPRGRDDWPGGLEDQAAPPRSTRTRTRKPSAWLYEGFEGGFEPRSRWKLDERLAEPVTLTVGRR